MRKGLSAAILAVVMVGVGLLGTPKEGDAAFHLMRVYGVMGGAYGDPDIQYVELRMTAGGQNLVDGHDICFYDATGAPYARFRFSGNLPPTGTSSILIGSTEFDAAWAAGSPDYTFNGSSVTQIASGADVFHPIRRPAGKVSFGTDSATMPAAMCQSGFTPSIIDSVAYGTGYTGTGPTGMVHYGTKFNTDLPSAGTSAVRLTGPLCTPGFNCAPMYTRDNSVDYSLLDVNVTANNPRNYTGQSGPLTPLDSDGDGVADPSDNCPAWPNPTQALPDWSVPPGDKDCDAWPDTGNAGSAFQFHAGEDAIGTLVEDHCNNTSGTSDEPLANDAWPPDFNDNQLVNGADWLHFNNALTHPTTDPDVMVGTQAIPLTRFDLNNNEFVSGSDVLQLNIFFFKRCEPLPP